jgi:hypothetical protein
MDGKLNVDTWTVAMEIVSIPGAFHHFTPVEREEIKEELPKGGRGENFKCAARSK